MIFPGKISLAKTLASTAASSAFLEASLAQLVEQLIRNEQVVGSSPMAGSIFALRKAWSWDLTLWVSLETRA